MTSMPVGCPTPGAASQNHPADEIARELACSYPVVDLAADGYLTGADGRAVAAQMREPQLSAALRLGRCSGTNDTDSFYRREDEEASEWYGRREQTLARYCTPCPVAAACLELALRYPEEPQDLAVRGGAAEEEQLALGREEADRLAAAVICDRGPDEQRARRLDAAREVQTLARTRIGFSVPVKYRKQNHADTLAAAYRFKKLTAEHRRATGWAA
ncbi:hypothetical protein C9F11_42940 (plasmid) [Streptomyces sp. YIM 121038]|uniref:WhiB family transcriptional regulator n=1 Tax=Streptomyces sp. YIM 121038 TaxID=2136401 RepID=UPI0011102C54|nr:WhiB family transcriptional regulator [Streptomyces sp. YIM 121038]QCX82168.1 hypothetical protein C9F11_42940 [Streptomyces sp. YIM 121038]